VQRMMAQQFFEDFQRHPRVEEVRRKRMPQAVGRIMGRETCRRQVLVHQPIDHRAEQVRPAALWTGKHIRPWRVVTPPALESLGDIGRKIDEAIDRSYTRPLRIIISP
jgi:hypothetical protein